MAFALPFRMLLLLSLSSRRTKSFMTLYKCSNQIVIFIPFSVSPRCGWNGGGRVGGGWPLEPHAHGIVPVPGSVQGPEPAACK